MESDRKIMIHFDQDYVVVLEISNDNAREYSYI